MKLKGVPLTTEQTQAAKAIIAGENCKIIAPAGSGKTTILQAGGRKISGYGLNISFNKSVAVKASKIFPKNIACSTGHALAFRSVGRKYSKRLTKLTGFSLSQSFDIGNPGHFKTLPNKAYQILETIRHFCYSSDQKISDHHVPFLKIQTTPEIIFQLRSTLFIFKRLYGKK